MSWWWDTYIDPLDLYPLFAGPAAFLKGKDLATPSSAIEEELGMLYFREFEIIRGAA